MKTLIITVGTRQIGWRCQDGVVRCFGADGDRGHPSHIDELYYELGQARSYHDLQNQDSRWGVRHLGEQFYELRQLEEDFRPVELLLDDKIIAEEVQQGLDHVIVWGTDQPETVPWSFRRADTLWLAQLMAGKIRQTWSHLSVDVWNPCIPANQPALIRQEVEGFILKYALDRLDRTQTEAFVLMVENKGSAPAIAHTLEVCAAALVRECEVQLATPLEPNPLYETLGEMRSSRKSDQTQKLAIGEYFWPLERTRIISAWERGDFTEAQLWLQTHQSRHPVLYRLAGHLALASNGQVTQALKELRAGWLGSKGLRQIASSEDIEAWQQQLNRMLPSSTQPLIPEQAFLRVWEASLLIEFLLRRKNFTGAFMQFAQTLEQVLYWHYQQGKRVTHNYITPPEHLLYLGEQYNPALGGLILGWCKRYKFSETSQWYQLLKRIRDKRNQIVHQAEPTTIQEICLIWTDGGLFPIVVNNEPTTILQPMLAVLKQVCDKNWQIPNQPLLRSLHEWGLLLLRSESAIS